MLPFTIIAAKQLQIHMSNFGLFTSPWFGEYSLGKSFGRRFYCQLRVVSEWAPWTILSCGTWSFAGRLGRTWFDSSQMSSWKVPGLVQDSQDLLLLSNFWARVCSLRPCRPNVQDNGSFVGLGVQQPILFRIEGCSLWEAFEGKAYIRR